MSRQQSHSLLESVTMSCPTFLVCTRHSAARLGILASAGPTRIIGVLLHGTSCCFRVQFVLTHETLIIFVMWFTKYAHFVLSCAMPCSLSRSIPWVNWEVPTICFILLLVYHIWSIFFSHHRHNGCPLCSCIWCPFYPTNGLSEILYHRFVCMCLRIKSKDMS